MPTAETARHKLPLLFVSQALKEITHNEALVRIDALLHPLVQDELANPPAVAEADIGKCWLVAASAVGDWSGKVGQIAIWIGGGWRFCAPSEGMCIRILSSGTDRVRVGNSWTAPPIIPDPANGAVIDTEARSAIISLLAHLRGLGQITS